MTQVAVLPGLDPIAPRIEYSVHGNLARRALAGGFSGSASSIPIASGADEADPFGVWWKSYLNGGRRKADRGAPPLRYVDLFSSVGGLSLGAWEAIDALGFRPVPMLGADIDERALAVYEANIRPRQVLAESIRSLVSFHVREHGQEASFSYAPTVKGGVLESLVGGVDLVLAGPPCQGHSSLNNHSRHDDPKNLLYLTVPAVAIALQAKYVVIENVPNVVRDRKGVVQTAMGLLRNSGYRIESGVLSADSLGWPQTRKRFFLVASRDSSPLSLSSVAEANRRESLPVSWALSGLEDVIDRTGADLMRSVPEMSPENRGRVNYLFDEDIYDLPNRLRPDCHRNGHTYPATYGRMRWEDPAPTITGGFLSPGRGRFVHPRRRRVLTPLEAARIQGFPDWFTFDGASLGRLSRAELSRWIGNAVPPILGLMAGLSVLGGEIPLKREQESQPIAL